jgi:hypothetical protein
MTDTEILDWMQQNATGIHEDINERMTVTWLDKSGSPRTTEGDNLRDCVRGAMADTNSRKDAPKLRTLGGLLREAAERGLPEKCGHAG